MRFGENVYPAEVEAVLNAHPAVARSAVIGRMVGGTEGGEEVVAFVQLKAGSKISEDRTGAACGPTSCALQATVTDPARV